jgi:succinate dehydrogenase/fumarate reductase flavoprotein subunit
MVRAVDSDVLILGSGGAGLRAAIEVDSRGLRAVIASKAPAGMNNCTVVAGGGFRAAFEGLTPEEHMKDTIEVGKGLNDKHLVEIFTKEGAERILEMRSYGVEVRVHKTGASVGSIPNLMGLGMTKPMVEYAKSKGIEFIDNVMVTKLLKRGNRVIGAIGYDVKQEEPIVFSSKAVVLATGGAGAIYKRTDCPVRTTGDGYSLGLHAGARLRDMEFVQFFPLALAEPGQPPYLIGGPLTEESRIINSLGEDIPQKYSLKTRPLVLKSRDLLSRAVMTEIAQGGGVDGAVLIDAREVFKKRSDRQIANAGINRFLVEKLRVAEKPFRVAPVCHFCMGGLVIDENGYTGVPGLYAAGEVVGGVHGANRHGGNALTDILVFGARSGKAASEYAEEVKKGKVMDLVENEIKYYESIIEREQGYSPHDVMVRLRETMWSKAGIIRDSASLAEAFEEVFDLKLMADRITAKKGRDILVALEAPMAIESAEMIIRAAMERKESRGAHYRTDYPAEDPKWLKPIYIGRTDTGALKFTTCCF